MAGARYRVRISVKWNTQSGDVSAKWNARRSAATLSGRFLPFGSRWSPERFYPGAAVRGDDALFVVVAAEPTPVGAKRRSALRGGVASVRRPVDAGPGTRQPAAASRWRACRSALVNATRAIPHRYVTERRERRKAAREPGIGRALARSLDTRLTSSHPRESSERGVSVASSGPRARCDARRGAGDRRWRRPGWGRR